MHYGTVMHPYGLVRDDRWLIGPTSRRIADVAFGLLMLIVGIASLVYIRSLTGGQVGLSGVWSMPSAVSGGLAVAGTLLVVRGALPLDVGYARWSGVGFGIMACLGALWIAAFVYDFWSIIHGSPAPVTGGSWLPPARNFSPPEHFALQLILPAALVLSARISRLRAFGMLLLGVLCSCVGIHVVTGETRFTFGLAELLDGVGVVAAVAGLIFLADAVICIAAPRLLLALTMRRIAGMDAPELSLAPGVLLRVAAVLVIAAVLALVNWIEGTMPVVTLVVFTLLGIAAKLLGCHRGVLLLGLFVGPTAETLWSQALTISRDDPTILVRTPTAIGLLAVTLALLLAGAVLSLLTWLRAMRSGAAPMLPPMPPPAMPWPAPVPPPPPPPFTPSSGR